MEATMKALRYIEFAALYCGLSFAQAFVQAPPAQSQSKEPGNFAARREASRLARQQQQNAGQNPAPLAPQPTVAQPSTVATQPQPVTTPARTSLSLPPPVAPRISYQN